MTESNEPQQELGDLDDWIFRVFDDDDELLDAICPEDSTPPSDLPEPEPSGALRLSRQEATAGVQARSSALERATCQELYGLEALKAGMPHNARLWFAAADRTLLDAVAEKRRAVA